VFFALLFAIIEIAIVFFADQTLETVAQGSARYVMTGQAQNNGFDQTAFKT
jgi:Flp pilus assembly protein TadG